jgi:hypothetical protein
MRASRPFPGLTTPLLLALAMIGAARADEPPSLHQGLWQFERTIGGKKLQLQQCVDPNEAMKRQNALLEKSGCKFSPGRRTGKTYTFSTDCTIKSAGGDAVMVRSTSVMTVDSNSAYKVEITTTGAGTSTQELLVARRLGDCTK